MLLFIIRQNLNESSAAAETREDQIPLQGSCHLCCLGPRPLCVLASHLLGDMQTLNWGRVGPVSSRSFPTCPILCHPQVLSRKRLKTPAYERDIPSKPAISSETKISLCLKYHFCFHASFLSCRNSHSLQSVTHIYFTDCLSDYVWLPPSGKCRAWYMLCVFK